MRFIPDFILKSTWTSFFVSLLIIISVDYYYRDVKVNGYWSRKNSDMMQAFPVELLKDSPGRALWYQHHHPPFLDAVRAVLAGLSDNRGTALLRDVDHGIFRLWFLSFAALGAVLFAWAKALSPGLLFPWSVFLLWHLHPSGYAIATYLDTTMLSSFLITLFLFEWWKIQFKKPRSSATRAAVILGVLFYVRVSFQFLFFIPHLLSVLLMHGSKKAKMALFVIPLLMVAPLILKQRLLFNTFYTTTLSGEHKLGMLWRPPAEVVSEKIARALEQYKYPADAPDVRDNSEKKVRENISYSMQAEEFIAHDPKRALKTIGVSVYQNLTKSFFEPTFMHVRENYLINAFPHIGISTTLLSGLGLVLWLMFATASWAVRAYRSGAPLRPVVVFLLPAFYVFLMSIVSNQGEWIEADRHKFFFEPAFFLFVCFEISRFPEFFRTAKMKGSTHD